jgi:hypothetical protein
MYYRAIYANANGSDYAAQIWLNNGGWSQLTMVDLAGLGANFGINLNSGSGTLEFTASGTNLQLFWQPTGRCGCHHGRLRHRRRADSRFGRDSR